MTDRLEPFIKITPLGPNEWQADVFIPLAQVDDFTLSKVLKSAKNKISRANDIPVGLLSYHELAEKEYKADGIKLRTNILRGEAEKCDPRLRISSAKSEEGTEYEEMALYLDLCPLKGSGEPLVKEEVMELISQSGIPLENVNHSRIEEALKKIFRDLRPMRNILAAEGSFPGPVKDARLQYLFSLYERPDGISMGKEKVGAEQLLCSKVPMEASDRNGHTIRGKVLTPREPLDIILFAGEGAKLLPNNTDIMATCEGIPRVKFTKSQESGIKGTVTVSVDPVEVIDGTNAVNITTDKNVEITDGLKTGSQVISQGEVLISGNVEGDSSITASGNVCVSGKVRNSSITSHQDVYAEGNVDSAKLLAHGKLEVKGTATDSELKGYEVRAENVSGCKVTGGSRVEVDTVSSDEKGLTSVISAGLVEHIKEKIKTNQEFIVFAKGNLVRIRDILGDKIIRETTPGNVMMMVIVHTREMRVQGVRNLEKEQVDAVRDLITTVAPMRDMMVDKTKQNQDYEHQIDKGELGNPEVIVRTAVEAPVEVQISQLSGEITPSDGAVRVFEQKGKIVKAKLKG